MEAADKCEESNEARYVCVVKTVTGVVLDTTTGVLTCRDDLRTGVGVGG